MGGSRDEAQSPQRRKHCASHTEPGCRMSPGVPPAPPHGPTLPPPRDRDQAHCEDPANSRWQEAARRALDFGPSLRLIYQPLSYAFQHQALRSVLGAHR